MASTENVRGTSSSGGRAGGSGAMTHLGNRIERAGKSWPRLDYILAVTVAALLILGLMMVYSATFDMVYDDDARPGTYLGRQVMWAALGLVVLVVLTSLDYGYLHHVSIPLMGVVLVLLVLVLIVGKARWGATRTLANGSIQPSELMKLAVVIYMADWLASKGDKIRNVSYGLLPFGILMGIIAGLIVLQNNFSTAAIVVVTAGVMFFFAGAELIQIAVGGAVTLATFGVLVANSAHAQERLAGFVAMLIDPSKALYQVQRTMTAIGSGGIWGRGLGDGRLKLGWVPLAHSDSIFAVVGEELGLIGCLIVVGLFALLAYRGFKVAAQATDPFGALLAAGATTWLIAQATFNIAAISGLAPLAGIPLPFITYGGSALVSAMGAVGVILSVSRGTHRRTRNVPSSGRQLGATVDIGRRDRRSRVSRIGGR